jgi:hypothetical protein
MRTFKTEFKADRNEVVHYLDLCYDFETRDNLWTYKMGVIDAINIEIDEFGVEVYYRVNSFIHENNNIFINKDEAIDEMIKRNTKILISKKSNK